MKHLCVGFAVVLAGTPVCSVRGQSNDPLKRGISTQEIGGFVAAYYNAVKRGDWAVVSDFCVLTADSKPKKYYYDSRASTFDDAAVWRITWQLPVVYTDPKTGAAPEISILVLGAFETPHEVDSPETTTGVRRTTTFHSLTRVTMDIWLRQKGQWRVIPEGELHMRAIHLKDLPYSGTGLGKQFEQLAEIEAKAKEDREKFTALKLQAEKRNAEFMNKIQPVLQDKSLTPEERQEALKKLLPTPD